MDVNGDTTALCGHGPATFGSSAVGNPDDGSATGTVVVAMGAMLPGTGPLYDLLFASMTPLTSPVLVAPVPMCTPAPPGCPE